jgi:hypothetical protein
VVEAFRESTSGLQSTLALEIGARIQQDAQHLSSTTHLVDKSGWQPSQMT